MTVSGTQHAADCEANSCVVLTCLILTRCSVKNVSQHNLRECLNSEIVITVYCLWIYNNGILKWLLLWCPSQSLTADVQCVTKMKCQNIVTCIKSFAISEIWHLRL